MALLAGEPVLRLALDVCAVGTVGALLAGGVLVAPGPSAPLSAVARRCARAGAGWAAGWSGLALAGAVMTGGAAGSALPSTAALLVTASLAALVALLAGRATTTGDLRAHLALALAAVLPVLLTGRAGHAAEDGSSLFLVLHVGAAVVWCGGLMGLVLHVRTAGPVLAVATARFSGLALWCLAAVALSGPLAAVTHLGASREEWTSGYGRLVMAKAALLLVLGGLGLAHRRSTLPRLRAGRPGAFRRLALGELAVMLAALASGVALGRVASGSGPSTDGAHDDAPVSGISAVGGLPGPDELLLGSGSVTPVSAVSLALALAALGGYLHVVRRVRARGGSWPPARSAAAAAAFTVSLPAVAGGLAAWAPELLSAHLGRHLLLTLVVPALVALAAPLTLWRRWRLHDPPWLGGPLGRAAGDPVNTAATWALVTAFLYGTPLLDLALRDPLLQGVVDAVAATAGLALWCSLLAVDPLAVRRSAGDRATVLTAVAGFLGVLGAVLLTQDATPASSWFLSGPGQGDAQLADQHRAGAVVLATAVLAVAVAVLIRQQARQQPPAAPAAAPAAATRGPG